MIDKRNLALSLSLNYFFKREKQLKVPEALPPQKAEHVFFSLQAAFLSHKVENIKNKPAVVLLFALLHAVQ